MTLPKLNMPTFEIKVPSTGNRVEFRPFLVKEEKILLIAQQSDNERDKIRALKQIIGNCITDETFNLDNLSIFDLEYLFLKIRSKSVNNLVTLQYQDNEDEKIYTFDINLDEVEIKIDEKHTNKIKVNESVGIVMKYPSVNLTDTIPNDANQLEVVERTIISCIDKIYDDETVYNTSENTYEELKEFVDNLDVNSYEQIKNFFDTMPKMYYLLEYENSVGSKRSIELSSLDDFFTWG